MNEIKQKYIFSPELHLKQEFEHNYWILGYPSGHEGSFGKKICGRKPKINNFTVYIINLVTFSCFFSLQVLLKKKTTWL